MLIFQGRVFVIGGRPLKVSRAISREKLIEKQKSEAEKEEKDTRNLWLAREGCELLFIFHMYMVTLYASSDLHEINAADSLL